MNIRQWTTKPNPELWKIAKACDHATIGRYGDEWVTFHLLRTMLDHMALVFADTPPGRVSLLTNRQLKAWDYFSALETSTRYQVDTSKALRAFKPIFDDIRKFADRTNTDQPKFVSGRDATLAEIATYCDEIAVTVDPAEPVYIGSRVLRACIMLAASELEHVHGRGPGVPLLSEEERQASSFIAVICHNARGLGVPGTIAFNIMDSVIYELRIFHASLPKAASDRTPNPKRARR